MPGITPTTFHHTHTRLPLLRIVQIHIHIHAHVHVRTMYMYMYMTDNANKMYTPKAAGDFERKKKLSCHGRDYNPRSRRVLYQLSYMYMHMYRMR